VPRSLGEQLKEVLTVPHSFTEDEFIGIRTHLNINPAIGVIITKVQDLPVAQRFETDILTMFEDSDADAHVAAHQIAEALEACVVVIGEPC